jgi:predicted ATPase
MEAIRLQNFKGFRDSGWIELKPITLLFGYNSSGKSSIMQALLMLKQSLENPATEVPFVFSSEKGVDLGTYEDIVYNHEIDPEKPVIFSLRVNIYEENGRSQEDFLKRFSLNTSEIEFSVSVFYDQNKKTNEIKEFSIRDTKGKNILSMSEKGFSSDCHPIGANGEVIWNNFIPSVLIDNIFVDQILSFLGSAIKKSFKTLLNIGPLRTAPKRFYLFSGENPASVGAYGENALQLLFLSKYNNELEELEAKVNDWLAAYNYQFEWKMLGSNLGQFILKDTRSGMEVNLKDAGFGLSQVLPVVIQAYAAPKDSIVLIEQPEIHLHSRAQAELGDLFLKAVSDKPKKLIIETHSENLLLRIQRRLAENYLKKQPDFNITSDNIAVYFIENQNGQSIAHKIPLNERGEFEDMPEGFKRFFTDDFEEVMKINAALAQIHFQKHSQVMN